MSTMTGTAQIGSIVATLTLDTSAFSGGIEDAQQQTRGLGNRFKEIQDIGKRFTQVGEAIDSRLSAPMRNFLKGSIDSAIQLDNSLGAVSQVLQQCENNIIDLRQAAMDASNANARLGFTATDVADAMFVMGINGLTAVEAYTIMEDTMRLASNAMIGLDQATDIVKSSMLMLGLEADQASGFMDTLVAASKSSALSIDEFGSVMKYVGPIAGALGMEYSDLIFLTGTLADAGIRGSQAGTTLRSVFTRLAVGTGNVSDVMADLGVSVHDCTGNLMELDQIAEQSGITIDELAYQLEDAGFTVRDANGNFKDMATIMAVAEAEGQTFTSMAENMGVATHDLGGEMRPMIDIIEDMASQFQYLDKDQQLYFANTVGGMAGMNGLMVLLEGVSDEYNVLRDAINEADGANERYADGLNQGVGPSQEEMRVRIENMRKEIGNQFLPIMYRVLEMINNLLDRIQQSNVDWAKWVAIIGGIVAVLGPVLIYIGKLVTAIGTIGTALGKSKKGIGLFKGKKAIGGMAPAMKGAVGKKSGGGMLGSAGKLLKGIGPKGWAIGAVVAGGVAIVRSVNGTRQSMEGDYEAMYIHTGSTTAAMAYSAAMNMGRMSDRAQTKMSELMREHYSVFDRIYAETGSKTEAMAAVTSTHFNQLKDNARSELSDLKSQSETLWNEVYRTTGSKTKANAAVAEAGFDRMKQEAQRSLRQLERDYQYYGQALPEGLETGINRGQPSAFTAIGDFARGIGDRFRSFFGINSPSTVMNDNGVAMGKGVENGLSSRKGNINTIATNIGNNIRDRFNQLPDRVQTIGRNVSTRLGNGINAQRQFVTSVANNVRDAARNPLSALQNQSNGWGGTMISRMATGISNGRNTIANAARNIASTVTNILGFNGPSEGPMKSYLSWMPTMIDIMSDTMEKSNGVIARSAMSIADTIYNNLGTGIDLAMAGMDVSADGSGTIKLDTRNNLESKLDDLVQEMKSLTQKAQRISDRSTEYNINIENASTETVSDVRKFAEEVHEFRIRDNPFD